MKRPRKTLTLRVSAAEANRVREHLHDKDTLAIRDVQTLLKILDDVYPRKRGRSAHHRWRPLLIGVAIGVLLAVAWWVAA